MNLQEKRLQLLEELARVENEISKDKLTQPIKIVHKQDCKRAFGNYDVSCPRCLELKAGAKPRAGWNDEKRRQEAMTSAAIHRHYLTPEGREDCKKHCGPVCVKFDY